MRGLEIYGVETTTQRKWFTLSFKIYTFHQILQAAGIVESGWTSQESWFDSRQGLFSKASRPAVEPTHPPIQCVPEILSPEKSD
jgi:hypothetical protein